MRRPTLRAWLATCASIGALAAPGIAPAAAGLPAAQDPAPARPAKRNTTGRDIPLGGPLVDGGFVLGDIGYTLTADDRILVDTANLLALLKPVLSPGAWQRLSDAIAARGTVTAEALAALGYTLDYDPATFGLRLGIAPEQRPTQLISVTGGYGQALGEIVRPAELSAYLTAYANADYVHRGFDRGFAPANVQLESAIRYKGVVFEAEAAVQGGFQRQGTRLVYDDLKRTARYALGDLDPISRGFSGAAPMLGASIVRIYSELEPQRNIQPRGQRSFTLTRPSTVETTINGQTVQQVRLAPGTYDIRDFPYAQGANDVRLLIRDDTGRLNEIAFSIAFDRSLLAPGLSEFGLFGGVEAPFRGGTRTYSDRPTASGFYRRGLSDTLTAGGNFQATTRGATAGAEVIWALSAGTLSFNLAGSEVRGIGTGYAFNLGYEKVFGSGFSQKTVTATFQATSANFATPTSGIALNPFAYELGVAYAQTIARDHYISLDGYYAIGRDPVPNQTSLRATYGWRSSNRLLLTAELSYEDRRFQRGAGARVGLTYRFDQRSSAQAEYDSRRERGRLTYQRADGRGVGAYNVSASLDRTPDITGLNVSGLYIANRAELGAAHLTSVSSRGNAIVDQRTSLRLGSSIAFADGALALSRPIYDGFAIFKPHRSLGDATVYVDPREESDLARSGPLGGAVAPDLSPYFPRVLAYDVPSAPRGYNLGLGTATVVPPYRGGYRIEVGSDYSVTVMGVLQRADGTPVNLAAGTVRELARPERPPVQMFTTRAGRFAIEGLRPGRWQVELVNGQRYTIEVPASAVGLVNQGVLKPETVK